MISDLFYEDFFTVYELEDRLEEIEDDEDYVEEYVFLLNFYDSMKELYSEFEYGEPLIRNTYFKDYAQELAEEIGSIENTYQWPYTCIDWTWAAELLKQDYDIVYVENIKYLILSD